jgi:hypothetical protein
VLLYNDLSFTFRVNPMSIIILAFGLINVYHCTKRTKASFSFNAKRFFVTYGVFGLSLVAYRMDALQYLQ